MTALPAARVQPSATVVPFPRALPQGFPGVLADAKAGRQEAFTSLFIWIGRPLLGFLRAQGLNDPDGAANEVLARAFRRIGAFEGSAEQFRSWIFTIARNQVIDDRRRAGRRVQTDGLALVDLERVGEAAPAADERALATAGMEELAVLLDRLSADQREVLTLRVIADLSIEQVASVMGKRAGAIKALQHRAIESLRRLLASESSGIRHSTDIGRGITR